MKDYIIDERGAFGPDERTMMRNIGVCIVPPDNQHDNVLRAIAELSRRISGIDAMHDPRTAQALAETRSALTAELPDVF